MQTRAPGGGRHLRWSQPTDSNPADDITRGRAPADLGIQSRWYQGPPFLLQTSDQWPESSPQTNVQEETEVRETTACNTTLAAPDPGPLDPTQFSSWVDLVRTAASVQDGAASSSPTAGDYIEAERALIKQHQ